MSTPTAAYRDAPEIPSRYKTALVNVDSNHERDTPDKVSTVLNRADKDGYDHYLTTPYTVRGMQYLLLYFRRREVSP